MFEKKNRNQNFNFNENKFKNQNWKIVNQNSKIWKSKIEIEIEKIDADSLWNHSKFFQICRFHVSNSFFENIPGCPRSPNNLPAPCAKTILPPLIAMSASRPSRLMLPVSLASTPRPLLSMRCSTTPTWRNVPSPSSSASPVTDPTEPSTRPAWPVLVEEKIKNSQSWLMTPRSSCVVLSRPRPWVNLLWTQALSQASN